MKWLAVLVLLAPQVTLVDQVYRIPAADWRYVQFQLPRQPVLVGCDYEMVSPHGAVRLALLTLEDMERLRDGRPHRVLASTNIARRGSLRYLSRQPGENAIIVDNRENRQAGRVQLRVFLDFSASGKPYVRTLSPQRRLAVILISFAVFFGIVFYSGRKLWRATRH